MKIFRDINHLPENRNWVLTQGTFDGVHSGHRKILNKMSNIAKSIDGETALLTFYPHPRHVLHTHKDNLLLLSTIEERIQLLKEAGLQNLIIIPFDEKFSQIEPEDFVKNILIEKFKINTLVIGYDHRFGKNRKGDFDLLLRMSEELKFHLEQITEFEIEEMKVSSTSIRKSLLTGDLEIANKLLGKPYLMKGKVIEGDKIGRTIGYPTANLELGDSNKLIPMYGVYAVKVKVDGIVYDGMLNVGNNPTIPEKKFSIEANIFDFCNVIYGKIIELYFIKRLRNEVKFNNLNELKQVLDTDKINAIEELKDIKI
jgi:riboflavin kinase / FMN adenylyltransferase